MDPETFLESLEVLLPTLRVKDQEHLLWRAYISFKALGKLKESRIYSTSLLCWFGGVLQLDELRPQILGNQTFGCWFKKKKFLELYYPLKMSAIFSADNVFVDFSSQLEFSSPVNLAHTARQEYILV